MRDLKCYTCRGTGHLAKTGKFASVCSTCSGAGKIPPLTADDERLVLHAAWAAWCQLAPDVDPNEKLSTTYWVEIVMDGDHLESFGSDLYEDRQRLRQLTRGLSATNHAKIRRWVREGLK